MANETTVELHERLAALGRRIEAQRHRSTAASGVPYGGSQWSDIEAAHDALVRRIAQERASDPGAIEQMRADVEALSLSLDGWIEGIDRHFATKSGGA